MARDHRGPIFGVTVLGATVLGATVLGMDAVHARLFSGC
jgi:hypothetical protein